jgi:hypothetical protein
LGKVLLDIVDAAGEFDVGNVGDVVLVFALFAWVGLEAVSSAGFAGSFGRLFAAGTAATLGATTCGATAAAFGSGLGAIAILVLSLSRNELLLLAGAGVVVGIGSFLPPGIPRTIPSASALGFTPKRIITPSSFFSSLTAGC